MLHMKHRFIFICWWNFDAS